MALTLEEFSDREFLFAFEEHADADGTVTSAELAEGMGLSASDGFEHPVSNVASRLSYLKRIGIAARDTDTRRWFLTDRGLAVLHSGLRARETRALEEFSDDALFAAVAVMGKRLVAAGAESATMASRQWRYSVAERKRRTR